VSDEAWWGRQAGGTPQIVAGPSPVGEQPELLDATAQAVRAALVARITGFTPDWRILDRPDPGDEVRRSDFGVALVRLFGTLAEPVLQRANRLPEKAVVEYLRIAGVLSRPATAAQALVQFTVASAAGGSVSVPAGFQIGAAPAGGQGDQVVFETDRAIVATPSTIIAAAVEEGAAITAVNLGGSPFAPFGAQPGTGNALWVGLSVLPGVAAPSPSLALAVIAAAPSGAPAPADNGGTGSLDAPPAPLLAWEVLDGDRGLVPAALSRDETAGLQRTGIVEINLPAWSPAQPPAPALPVALWLRARLLQGSYPAVPELSDLQANMARATALRTIRNEILQRLPDDQDGRAQLTLSQRPVVPGSVQLVVSGDTGDSLFGIDTGATAPPPWTEVDSLAAYGPTARVFTLDPQSGLLTFGDGTNGLRLPDGFQNVSASVYRAGGGAAGSVAAGAISAMLSSVRFVSAVTNPYPASGGTDAELEQQTVLRGGQDVQAGGRAVAPGDYAVLAMRSPGANVARAHAIGGFHPSYPGRRIPGIVGVLVVPPADTAHTASGPPLPTGEELRAVADYLSSQAAPAGIDIVTAAPHYHTVALTAWLVLDPARDQADTLQAAGLALDAYLDPIGGGDGNQGWPFGGTLVHTALVRRLLDVPGVMAVPQLAIVFDGLRLPPCTDQPIRPDALVFPARHELLPVSAGVIP
jgi:predicted phage baseplate assembly protein